MTPELADEIYRVADRVSARWADVISSDDLAQEVWAHLLEKRRFDRLAGMHEGARYSTLMRIASQIAAGERNDHEIFSGQVYYGVDEVRSLLDSGLLSRRREEIDPATETLSVFIDLHEGVDMLRRQNNAYAGVINSVFLEREDEPDRKRVTRAVEALARCMNRVHKGRRYDQGPGSRRAVSNATARGITV